MYLSRGLAAPATISAATRPLPYGTQPWETDHERGPPKGELQNWSSLIGIVTAIVGNVLIALALNVQRYAHLRLHRKRAEVKARARQALRNAQKLHQAGSGGYGTPDCGRNHIDAAHSRYMSGASAYSAGAGAVEAEPLVPASPAGSSRSDDKEDLSATNYLRSPYWWLGQVLITVGEMGNFLAYGFAPASIVSPLGVVALISNCVIAPIIFKEKFRLRDFWGVVVAVAGAVTVVFSANTKENKLAPEDVWHAITTLEFEIYMAVSCSLIVFLMWASPRYGHRSILIDLGLVGLFGAYTALSTKGVSSMLSSTLLGAFKTPVTYVLVFVLLATAVMQVRYVNKALQRFDSTQVIPIQFVIFTLSVIIGSAVLYRDFEQTTAKQAVTFVGGCVLTFFGVFLITSGRTYNEEDANGKDDDDDHGKDALSDLEGVDETISLHNHQASGGNDLAGAGADEGRSRRSSRVSFMEHGAGKPVTVVLDSTVRSLRQQPKVLLEEAEETSGLLDHQRWIESPPPEPSTPSHRGHSLNVDGHEPYGCNGPAASSLSLFTEPLSRVRSEPGSTISSPRNEYATATTPSASDYALGPRPATSGRSQPHHFSGPLFSPSPLSSTVSAVVADTLLLRSGGESPTVSRRLAMRRSRPSLRSSLFVPHDEAMEEGDIAAVATVTSTPSPAPWAADGTDPSRSDGAAAAGPRPPAGIRGRARSLSYTLGELFGSRSRRQGQVSLENDGDGDQPAPGRGSRSTEDL